MSNVAIDSAWFVTPYKKPHARFRLFCFPHAGGAASAYFRWGSFFDAQVTALQLPGREGRMAERPVDDLKQVVEAVAQAIACDEDRRPFAFFGHSMGALLAYETAREMRRRQAVLPFCLLVSGRAPPSHISDESMLHQLPDQQFIDELDRRFSGVPVILREEPELMSLFLPVIRADLKMLETHTYVDETPLDVPLGAFCGREDARARLELLQNWAEFTTQWRGAKEFAGGHFYLHQPNNPVLGALASELEACLDLTRQRASG